MPEQTPPFSTQQIGTSGVRFPSGAPIPNVSDQATDPYAYAKIRASREIQVEAVQFWPQVKETYPGVVLLHESWGLNAQIRDWGSRLACQGYAVLIPNLYTRQGGIVTANAEVAAALMGRIKDGEVLQDINSCCEFLNTRDYAKRNLHAVIGFGMGGTLAMQFACQRKRLRAAVAFYGRIGSALGLLKELHCPLLYHHAGGDEGVTAEEITELHRIGRESGKRIEVRTYDQTPPAFCNEHRPDAYRLQAAQAAWDTTLAFLGDCLKADR